MSFYVGLVVKRWWEQYRLLPWPDTLALFASAAIPGTTVSKHTFNNKYEQQGYTLVNYKYNDCSWCRYFKIRINCQEHTILNMHLKSFNKYTIVLSYKLYAFVLY